MSMKPPEEVELVFRGRNDIPKSQGVTPSNQKPAKIAQTDGCDETPRERDAAKGENAEPRRSASPVD